ncbi:MAG: hypothetical protein A2600_07505 [Candidatus Lambdaproteobacteria bacterium RIFOXYD1_FULL_56_27]|uniref:Uncharacterized protein n=1 Tax=Candidatus Lambdaproteobacteria bacterium RIFOXYD2_FULL_56_26 TaxID=1817773 RepID=A0A1F6GNK8_9PROT|nr:MAG: hypothetical protein A2557_09010 [Candidatus Lambdaproteobacteria bacterium RIFOXYD2_FULL_56_26]OGH05512.1 MAG: hypothetical protein A2426_03950 [Candidatus Lambdaproteobacteria bacterium RIFOXYC1_FULL_56_13]OGH09713.1 MAG: hypothetical protein A2600_07505 [Candidatus Lambdaproteobacteria bacterium RIFOXYD1_FULL_56_27]
MKLIYPNAAETQEQPAETLAGFPIGNLLSPHKLEVWKAQAGAAPILLDFVVNGPSSGLALFGLNADEVTVSLFSDPQRTQAVQTWTQAGTGQDPFGGFSRDSLWFEYPELPLAYGRLSFTCVVQMTPSLGILCAGPVHRFPNPSWGFEDEWIDNSVVKKLRVGAKYTKAKAKARRLSGGIEFFHQQGGRTSFEGFKRFRSHLGPDPFACLAVENLTDPSGSSWEDRYLIWGSFSQFKAVLGRYSHSTVTLTLEEYL